MRLRSCRGSGSNFAWSCPLRPTYTGGMANWVTSCIVLVAAYVGASLLETLSLLQYTGHLQGQRLSEYYGWAACLCLFLVLIAQRSSRLLAWRRGLGIATFGLALAHAWLSILHVLGGSLGGIEFLSDSERFSTWIGGSGLVLMVPLVLTSSNVAVKWLGIRRWKALHRLVFVVGLLCVVHSLWWGASPWPVKALLALATIVIVVERFWRQTHHGDA
jgi:DMSO/TMAO reductase YedYZ heme-binding membrane subunit